MLKDLSLHARSNPTSAEAVAVIVHEPTESIWIKPVEIQFSTSQPAPTVSQSPAALNWTHSSGPASERADTLKASTPYALLVGKLSQMIV